MGEKFPGQTGSLEFFTALPDKIFCLGLSSHSWPSGKFVYARYAHYTNSNTLLWLRLSSINVFCPHFVPAKNRPSGLKRLSSPRQILLKGSSINYVSIFEWVGGPKMLMVADMGEGGYLKCWHQQFHFKFWRKNDSSKLKSFLSCIMTVPNKAWKGFEKQS